MLELLGKGYIIDLCVCNLKKISKDNLYRIYVTDTLKTISHNTAHMVESGITMQARYIDIIDKKAQSENKPKETAEQIKKRIMAGVNALAKKEN